MSNGTGAKFSKDYRITKQAEIDGVYKTGRRVSGKLLKVIVKVNNLPNSRLAISVPRKLCNSVKRNRWRRMIRESFRLNKTNFTNGIDILAIPLVSPDTLKMQNVAEEFIKLLVKFKTA